MRRLLFLSGLTLCLLPALATAATFGRADMIPSTARIQGNLYLTGSGIVTPETTGNLMVAGAKIDVAHRVGWNASVAGGEIFIQAPVGQEVHAAGGKVTLTSTIGSDAFAAGGKVIFGKTAITAGDLTVFGGDVTVDGKVSKMLRVYGGKVAIGGTVAGDAIIVSDSITLKAGAHINGNIRYWQEHGTTDFSSVLSPGKQATFDPALRSHVMNRKTGYWVGWVFAAAVGVFFGAILLSSLIIIAGIVMINRTFLTDASHRLQAKPFWCFLVGIGYLFGIPIVALLLFLSIIGIPLGLFLSVLYAFLLFFMAAITAPVYGIWLQKLWAPKSGKMVLFLLSIGVLIVIKLLFLLPVIGAIAKCLLVSAALGALAHTKWIRIQKIL